MTIVYMQNFFSLLAIIKNRTIKAILLIIYTGFCTLNSIDPYTYA